MSSIRFYIFYNKSNNPNRMFCLKMKTFNKFPLTIAHYLIALKLPILFIF